MHPPDVDAYLADGCGRCDLHHTPECKVHRWPAVLVALRERALAAGLREEIKWGCPCYSVPGGGNVAMVSAYKEFACVSFFKGSLLADPEGRLEAPGPNSQAARLYKFTDVAQVHAARSAIDGFFAAAVELERRGARVEFARTPEPVPAELQACLDADASLAAAYAALTPGRQRSHVLHVAGAKTEAGRQARAARCAEKIREGKGFLDR